MKRCKVDIKKKQYRIGKTDREGRRREEEGMKKGKGKRKKNTKEKGK